MQTLCIDSEALARTQGHTALADAIAYIKAHYHRANGLRVRMRTLMDSGSSDAYTIALERRVLQLEDLCERAILHLTVDRLIVTESLPGGAVRCSTCRQRAASVEELRHLPACRVGIALDLKAALKGT